MPETCKYCNGTGIIKLFTSETPCDQCDAIVAPFQQRRRLLDEAARMRDEIMDAFRINVDPTDQFPPTLPAVVPPTTAPTRLTVREGAVASLTPKELDRAEEIGLVSPEEATKARGDVAVAVVAFLRENYWTKGNINLPLTDKVVDWALRELDGA